jgi:uncharacterized membrane protein YeaQ/YmgE (transglycosylase-associated protein family)
MGLLSWILFGLVAGADARLVVPGAQRIGCLATIAVGIVGALIGVQWSLAFSALAVVLIALGLFAVAHRRRRPSTTMG